MQIPFVSAVSVEELRFIRQLEDVNLKEVNVTATFECELSKEGLQVEWTKDGKKLRRGDRHDVISQGKVHKLVIEKVTAEDVGSYTATHEKLSTKAKLNLAGIAK